MDTALGPLLLARTARGLCGVWFEGQRHAPSADCFAPPLAAPDDALLRHAGQQLLAYFAGQAPHFDVPLDLSAGTPFQQSVWRQLLSLAHGQLGSYGAIARALGQAQAARAVGAAVGRNPISILVPCHRVLGRNGQLTGYAGGLWRKQALLRLEGHTLF
ncbi:MAG: methylated-DNA--[protein]-cysteine S-methyltransferase [Betaproteobacteria bacterium]|nr:methylated-DNA--[protein]-cysteine S-methyltransferase [Betaproteobacteria bacterium]